MKFLYNSLLFKVSSTIKQKLEELQIHISFIEIMIKTVILKFCQPLRRPNISKELGSRRKIKLACQLVSSSGQAFLEYLGVGFRLIGIPLSEYQRVLASKALEVLLYSNAPSANQESDRNT